MAKQKKKPAPALKKPAAGKKNNVSNKKPLPGSSKTSAKKLASKKAVTAKKQVPPKKALAKKSAKPILKSAPAKKTAKLVVKKAAPKKLATPKKTSVLKPGKLKKIVNPSNKKVTETYSKIPKKVIDKLNSTSSTEHKQKLKTAISITSSKNREVSKKPLKPFVMPKTNTEKSRKYEPQFVKSVLDHAPEENSGPSMRYSDNELTEFKELITRKLETAKKELGYLQGLITRKDEMGGDDTDNRYMTMEDGSLSMEREQLSQMASRQITFIDHLEKAMMRIENKTYGICRVTGKLIDKARLRAVQHATLSIEAKMGISK
ncbi:MAG: TraR/DksA C4-type zinc finger protein [Ginsengibacter sp.]